MGMYDELRCKRALPVDGFGDRVFQTKDTEAQALDLYEIREDGTLWHELYDTEDRSDPNAEGLLRICGMATRINQRWEQVRPTGEIRFYTFYDDATCAGWVEFSAYFVEGALRELHCVQNSPPATND